jgi:anti-sigma factor (TIGR02949 family)
MRWNMRRTVSCRDVLVGLQAYLDGETDLSVARQLAGHLDHCDHCDYERQLYADIKSVLGSRRVDVDPEIRAALVSYSLRLSRGELA